MKKRIKNLVNAAAILMLVMSLIGIAPTSSVAAQTNLLQNPGFESDFTNWHMTGNTSISTAGAEVHAGAKAIKHYSSSAYNSWLENRSTNLSAGTYTAKVWARSGGSFSQRFFQVFVSGVKVKEISLPVTSTWTEYTINSISVPAGATVMLGLWQSASGGAWAQEDDFSLTNDSVASTGSYIKEGADPSIIKEGGYYYSVHSDGGGVQLRSSSTMDGLRSSSSQTTIWWTPSNMQQVWAPEIVKINNAFWVLFAASPGWSWESFATLNARHRTYALKATNPAGPYTYMGKVPLPDDKWSIDASMLSYGNKNYIVWSGWEGDADIEQTIYIAQVDVNNPMLMLSGRSVISQPREAWERKDGKDPYVNEAPQPIVKDGRLIIAYSTNSSWTKNYCLGMLRLNAGGNPLNVKHYAKSDSCIFQYDNKILAPGHHSWILEGSNGTGLIAYHGVPSDDTRARDLWAKRIVLYKAIDWKYQDMWQSWENRWDAGPFPILGNPAANYVRLEASNYAGGFVRHANGRGRVDANVDPYVDSAWKIVPGLADPSKISFEAVNYPGAYLRHRNGEVWADTNDGSSLFKNDATWTRKSGLSNGNLVSYESFNFPGAYIRHRDGLLYGGPIYTDLDRQDATFIER